MPTPYIVEIPSDVTALPIEGLGELLASAIYDVESDVEDEGVKRACTALEFDRLIQQALECRQLVPRVRASGTPMDYALPGCAVSVKDLQQFLTDNQINVELSITPDAALAKESAAVMGARHWQACLDAGLAMPTDTYAQFPRGIAQIAQRESIKRQTFAKRLNAYREEKFSQ